MNTKALIIFVRNPELGKVKTRLGLAIGNENALAIYNQLLNHTMETTKDLHCELFVFYDTQINNNDIWDHTVYNKKIQAGNNLGERMENAFQEVFDLGFKNCVIIGSDLYDLKTNHINEAFNKLDCNEVVIGPAEDGGYYLLGLKKIISAIFSNKNWGTETVLEDTLKDIAELSVYFLETLNDIDTLEDLEKSNYYSIKNGKLFDS